MAWPLAYNKYVWRYFNMLAELSPKKCLPSGLFLVAIFLVAVLMMIVRWIFVVIWIVLLYVLSVIMRILKYPARQAMSAGEFVVTVMRVRPLVAKIRSVAARVVAVILVPLRLLSNTIFAVLRGVYTVMAVIFGVVFLLFIAVLHANFRLVPRVTAIRSLQLFGPCRMKRQRQVDRQATLQPNKACLLGRWARSGTGNHFSKLSVCLLSQQLVPTLSSGSVLNSFQRHGIVEMTESDVIGLGDRLISRTASISAIPGKKRLAQIRSARRIQIEDLAVFACHFSVSSGCPCGHGVLAFKILSLQPSHVLSSSQL
ncbi:hypothetical protein J6590_046075 [Homalodisca vitripennis]|nr:hypothetical protein J6590_046075 [Homalodisca vitripennis]